MKINEIIFEVIDIGGPGPETIWSTERDIDAYKNPTVHVGKWLDPAGNQVKSEFRKDLDSPGQTEIKFRRTLPDTHPDYHPAGTMDITGTGQKDAPKIFSGVVNNVKTFLDQHPDQKSVVFKSEQPSRTRLYSKMIDRLAPQMGMIGTKVDRDGGAATFQLNRAGEGETHQPISKPREKSITSKTPPPSPPKLGMSSGGPSLERPGIGIGSINRSGRMIGPTMGGGGGPMTTGEMLRMVNPLKI